MYPIFYNQTHVQHSDHRNLRRLELIILLAGGDKATQRRDIQTALALVREL